MTFPLNRELRSTTYAHKDKGFDRKYLQSNILRKSIICFTYQSGGCKYVYKPVQKVFKMPV